MSPVQSPDSVESRAERRPVVVLLHGFMRTGWSMAKMARTLEVAGFDVCVVTQNNFNNDVDALAENLRNQAGALLDAGDRPVHFVTHSLGGVVVRRMLVDHKPRSRPRVVMLAPPNQGSRLAGMLHDRLLHLPWGRFDPLGKFLPDDRGGCISAGLPEADIGIIAGVPGGLDGSGRRRTALRTGLPVAWAPDERGHHDGRVALDEASLRGAVDMVVVPHGHAFLASRKQAITQTLHFLQHGRFLADSLRLDPSTGNTGTGSVFDPA